MLTFDGLVIANWGRTLWEDLRSAGVGGIPLCVRLR